MSASDLLGRLDKVRKRGGDSWTACCPAHDDRGPSLAVRELADGRVLVHCFAGCGVLAVLSAVGLDFDALYPPRALGEHFTRPRHAFNATDALRCLEREASILLLASRDMVNGRMLTAADRERVVLASSRINEALALCDG